MEIMEKGETTYKVKRCPYRHSWVNQGIASCDKGKNPFKDCSECEYQEEVEVTTTWASTEK